MSELKIGCEFAMSGFATLILGDGETRCMLRRDAELQEDLKRRERARTASQNPDCRIFQVGEAAEGQHCKHAGHPVSRKDGALVCLCRVNTDI